MKLNEFLRNIRHFDSIMTESQTWSPAKAGLFMRPCYEYFTRQQRNELGTGAEALAAC
jgi:hypothetical protein